MRQAVKYPRWVGAICIAALAICVLANAIFPPPIKAAKSRSAVVNSAGGEWLAGFSVEDGRWRLPVQIDELDPRFIERLITIEDSRFWTHSGVDIPAIVRAAKSWRAAGRPVSGASTLTMQLVRQVEPRPRTLTSKAIESLRALQYELFLSKEDILSLYLTHISYGGNLEGIMAASWAYFGKPPEQLTNGEIALLLAIPQAPEARRPDLHPAAARAARLAILNRLQANGLLSETQVEEADSETLPTARHDIDQTAWVSARALARPNQSVQSTLSKTLQLDLEGRISQWAEQFPNEVNIAVTVVENDTMAVRAHLASAGRERAGGWIDMTRQTRSPGSTLKPFIYAMAIDDGLISSATLINDLPSRFGQYRPENFDRRFHGQVRIYEALRHSLNIPAVAILDRMGGARFEDELVDAGVNIKRLGSQHEKAGLAVALGGLGMTANDLAESYAALANGGGLRPLRWYESDKIMPPKRLMSEKAAADITHILRQSPMPEGTPPTWLSKDRPAVAYKTGTSYGFRDAWAAGYTDKWTVIVWVGRPDGAPHINQTGRKAAAPILFDVFGILPEIGDQTYQADEMAPKGLKRMKDYTESGPQIMFPPDGSEILAKDFGQAARGFTLTARTEGRGAQFFADGMPVPTEDGRAIWRPSAPGFYSITAIDEKGRKARSKVRVLSLDQMADTRF